MTTAVEVAARVYARWNAGELSALADAIDPRIELVSDPLRPAESALRGRAGWEQWVARWEASYEDVHVTVDGLVPIDPEHVLALVSITATPAGAQAPLQWAAAHLWTVRAGRIAGWATHLDLAAARQTLEA
ncbi:MAG TPA: nuclear transport factor 2 family protein [Solirubrobacteraceae bacterium]|jgi:ketosteroid isomerase-like protein